MNICILITDYSNEAENSTEGLNKIKEGEESGQENEDLQFIIIFIMVIKK
jgi:hypothetical protein